MPIYSGMAYVLFFAGLGLPGLCGFWGEVWVTLSAWNYSHTLAIISASVVVLTAAYILWTLQRVYLGPEYKGPHGDHLHDVDARELAIGIPLIVGAIFFGVNPNVVVSSMEPTISADVKQLADWTKNVKAPKLRAEAAAKEAEEIKDIEKKAAEAKAAAAPVEAAPVKAAAVVPPVERITAK
jgi:NADH-quinone oxidoreductase subunit M